MRILMVNLPFAGHTNPTLPLAKALVAAVLSSVVIRMGKMETAKA